MRRVIALLAAVAVVGLAILARIHGIKSQEAETREGIETIQLREGFPVVTAPVHSGEFSIWRDMVGKVQGNRQVEISTIDQARIKEVKYEVGDVISSDEPIIVLDEGDPKESTQLRLLRKVYNDAKRDYEIYDRLYRSGKAGISRDVRDKMKLKYESAKSNLEAASAYVELVSPIDGTLIALYAREGEVPESGKALAIVSALDQVRIVAKISDQDAAEVERGQTVAVVKDGRTLQGTVDRTSIGANPENGLFDLEMVVDNPDNRIKVGTYVTARVRVFFREDANYVHYRCLMREGSDHFIYQVEDGKARKVKVEVVASSDDYSVVRGADPDLAVVKEGKSLLSPGAQVSVVEKEE